MSHIINHYKSGLIETLSVAKDFDTTPYMVPLEARAVVQSFSGTGATERAATVGYVGKCADGITLALGSGQGWVGVRRDGSRSLGNSLYNALVFSGQLPWEDLGRALVGIQTHTVSIKWTETHIDPLPVAAAPLLLNALKGLLHACHHGNGAEAWAKLKEDAQYAIDYAEGRKG